MTDTPVSERLGLDPGPLEMRMLRDAAMRAIRGIPGLAALRTNTSPDFWQQVNGNIGRLLGDLIDLPLADFLGAAWRTDISLLKYADVSRWPPDTQIRVELASHDILSNSRPYVDLLIEGISAGRMQLDVSLRMSVEEAGLIIQPPRITAATMAKGRIAARVQIEGTTVLERTRAFSLPRVSYGDGILIGTPI